jgi:co-chaperonin GroES (HSP10)
MKVKLTAVFDQIVCVRQEKLKTDGGIIMPTTSQKQNIAEVISVGPMVKYVKPGDKIFLFRDGQKLSHEGTDYTIIKETADYFIILGEKKLDYGERRP